MELDELIKINIDAFVASGDVRMVEDDHTDIDRIFNSLSDAKAIIDTVYPEADEEQTATEETEENNTSDVTERVVSVEELIHLPDDLFLRQCYRLFFGRVPDVAGYQNYASALVTNRISKPEIIQEMVNSEEGRMKAAKISGLTQELLNYGIKKRTQWNRPIIGRISKIVYRFRHINQQITAVGAICSENDYENERKIIALEKSLKAESAKNSQLNARIDDLQQQIWCQGKTINEFIQKEARQKADYNNLLHQYFSITDWRVNRNAAVDSYYVSWIDKWSSEYGVEHCDLRIADLNCYSSEWLDRLKQNDYYAKGNNPWLGYIESDSDCNDLRFTGSSIMDFLKDCSDESFDCLICISAFDCLDHASCVSILCECNRVLRKNGLLLIETTNPNNSDALCRLSINPDEKAYGIHPEALKTYIDKCGFTCSNKESVSPLCDNYGQDQAYGFFAVKSESVKDVNKDE